MTRSCFYDETKDNMSVDQVGFIDLGDAIRNGYVPGSMTAEEEAYDNIESPDGLMRNADDVFALYRQADYIKSFQAPVNEEATE